MPLEQHSEKNAPGWPGSEAVWSHSRKRGIGTSVSAESCVWFTLGDGYLTELYYPSIDQATTKDMRFLVTAADGFFSEEGLHTDFEEKPIHRDAPGYCISTTCHEGRYRIIKRVVTDPLRPTVLLQVLFEPLIGKLGDYRLFALLAPQIGNQGSGNDAWTGVFNGRPMLFAQRHRSSLAFYCSKSWKTCSVGYVGKSDGWQQVKSAGSITEPYNEASDGNVALTGEIDLEATDGSFSLTIGFGHTPFGAANAALATVLSGVKQVENDYIDAWKKFQSECDEYTGPVETIESFNLFRMSIAVLRTLESKVYRGACIASLSVPWGMCHGEDEAEGYHMVWPRDMIHIATGMLAVGNKSSARQSLLYLMVTQEADGHWPQNMWADGTAHLEAYQADQTGAFLCFARLLARENALDGLDPWLAVERAATSLYEHGPYTDQDRWEENRGYTPYTMALVIAGLICSAQFARERGDSRTADAWLNRAKEWNGDIERLLYVKDTPLAKEVGVEGYYIRIVAEDTDDPANQKIRLRNQPPDSPDEYEAWRIVSPDALALVRYGLREARDERILNTVKVIDHCLKRPTANGHTWLRYNHDGYGESADGTAFNGSGLGHGWPVLTGERAHYELAAGNRSAAERLLKELVTLSGPSGLLPEQIWDLQDVPDKGLFNGCATGAAMPLGWAHAEFLSLLRSLKDKRIFNWMDDVRHHLLTK